MPPIRSRDFEDFSRSPKQNGQHVRRDHHLVGVKRNVGNTDEEINDVESGKSAKLDSSRPPLQKSEGLSAKSAATHGLPDSTPSKELIFYPAYCHQVSPTWFTWVKLTALDIHQTLQIRDGYQHILQIGFKPERNSSVVLFYLNHPIQFVQVVGVVISLEPYFERFWLFTVDDSSGATVDVICNKPVAKVDAANTAMVPPVTDSNGRDVGTEDEDAILAELNKQVAEDIRIGAVVQIKGTVTLFRRHKGVALLDNVDRSTRNLQNPIVRPQQLIDVDRPTRQISLSRLQLVPSTSAEISLIDARTQFHTSVLSRPWVLSSGTIQKLRHKAFGEIKRVRKRSARQTKNIAHVAAEEARDADMIRREYEHEDNLRLLEADLAKNAGEELRRQKGHKFQNTSSEHQNSLEGLDEKALLLRAAFG